MSTMNGNKRAKSGQKRAKRATTGKTVEYKVTGILGRCTPRDFAGCAEVNLVPSDLVGLALVLHIALDSINELAPPCSCGKGVAEYVVGTLDGKDVTLQQMLTTALMKLNAPLPVSAIQHEHDAGGDFS